MWGCTRLKALHHFTLVGVCGILTAAKQTLTPDRKLSAEGD
jgi:hypothetical protein